MRPNSSGSSTFFRGRLRAKDAIAPPSPQRAATIIDGHNTNVTMAFRSKSLTSDSEPEKRLGVACNTARMSSPRETLTNNDDRGGKNAQPLHVAPDSGRADGACGRRAAPERHGADLSGQADHHRRQRPSRRL